MLTVELSAMEPAEMLHEIQKVDGRAARGAAGRRASTVRRSENGEVHALSLA